MGCWYARLGCGLATLYTTVLLFHVFDRRTSRLHECVYQGSGGAAAGQHVIQEKGTVGIGKKIMEMKLRKMVHSEQDNPLESPRASIVPVVEI